MNCHTCSQLTIYVTRSKADVLGVAKALSRADAASRPTGRLKEQLAYAKNGLAENKRVLAQHQETCEAQP